MPSPRSTVALGAVLAAVCLAAVACAPADSTTVGSATPTAAGSQDAWQGEGYPVTLDVCGVEQTFEQAPERVVVMNGASVAEVSTLLALGLEDRIVANAQSYGRSEVKGRAEAIDKLPTGDVRRNDLQDFPRESMLALKPDLVLSTTGFGFRSENGFATREELAKAGADTYIPRKGCDERAALDDPPTIEDSYAMLRDLGAVFDVRERAEKRIDASEKRIAATAEAVREARRKQGTGEEDKPEVLVVFANMSMGANQYSSVAARGIWNDILARAGARNAFADASPTMFADLSAEQLAATDVDAVVVVAWQPGDDADAYARELLDTFPQWPAAREDRYTVLSDSIYLGPSNHLAVERVAGLLYPATAR
ncbi:ABC transporter substrate-binding protein [Streptomyces sp. JJ38]|uniref:ABC transporter substrate-binding protein n=1 Tax=Streptomyces sp. JJ38 TaxID=2738128 RepID=UPI001C58C8DD|nr:ABC transporter substrate-binding protein [Streptomyces sp. JJ38]MBW1597482.1 ABC transporter substrate-binding protein [Streptomyces sp. JJ38]